MKLGLGTYGCAWAIGVNGYPRPQNPLDASAFLQWAGALGLHLVQIADNLPLHSLSPKDRANLKHEADQLGIAIEVGTRGIQHEHLHTYLAIAQEMGSGILRVVVDSAEHHPTPDEVVDILRPIMPTFAQANVILAIENHDRFKVKTLVDIIQRLDSPYVGICLDTVNSFGSLEGSQVVVETLAPYVVNLHVKEFVIKRLDHNMGFSITGAPTGQGMMDVPWLLAELDKHGRKYNAIIETWLSPVRNADDQIDMEATIAIEADWVRESVSYLRTIIHE
jgi:sugar phosphate isomerase/epimerase